MWTAVYFVLCELKLVRYRLQHFGLLNAQLAEVAVEQCAVNDLICETLLVAKVILLPVDILARLGMSDHEELRLGEE